MVRYLPILIWLGLLIYCLVDCAQSEQSEVRNLPKIAWIGIIVVFPFAGAIGWLVAGRPRPQVDSAPPRHPTEATGLPEFRRPVPPEELDEIDEKLRLEQERVDREYEEALRKWEESRRHGEQGEPGGDGPA